MTTITFCSDKKNAPEWKIGLGESIAVTSCLYASKICFVASTRPLEEREDCYDIRHPMRALRLHWLGLRGSRRSTMGLRRDIATMHMRRGRHAVPGLQYK
jgi:hypothetical protein